MKTILATAYFPSISYIANILNNQDVVVDNYEYYIKQTYRNRCKILSANGPLILSVPVGKGGIHKPLTKDIQIDYSQDWQKIHWRSIESAYNNSPFFLFYKDSFRECLFIKHKFIIDLNSKLIEIIMGCLKIKPQVYYSGKYLEESDEAKDFRKVFLPNAESGFKYAEYQQVFSEKFGFQPDLSIIDLLFNVGPDSVDYLRIIKEDIQF